MNCHGAHPTVKFFVCQCVCLAQKHRTNFHRFFCVVAVIVRLLDQIKVYQKGTEDTEKYIVNVNEGGCVSQIRLTSFRKYSFWDKAKMSG